VVTPARSEELRSSANRLGILPRVESHLLGAMLKAVGASHPIERAVATVLVPAQSLGDPGAEELHQQIVHILNFKTPPTDVLEAGLSLADTVAWEAERLAGIEGTLTVSLVQVPVFHGYSAALWIETEDRADGRTIRSLFRRKPFESPKSSRGAKPPSPVSAAGTDSIHIGPVRASVGNAPSGFWLWAVADTTAYDPSAAAIEIVRSVLA
jgi:aspartate-semialdehyde dehydrogenase